MKRIVILVLLLSLISCSSANNVKETPMPSITVAPTYTPIPTVTNTPVLYKITFNVFYDYNGNGAQDDGEPKLLDIEIQTKGKSCSTGIDGKCEIDGVSAGNHHISIIDNHEVSREKKMRYILPSISDARKIGEGMEVVVDGNQIIVVPLAQGLFTLPLESNDAFELFSYYDLDPTNGVRNYAGSTIVAQGNINTHHINGTAPGHNGIDYLMQEGKNILAAAPGTVIEMGDNFFPNCKAMLMVRILHPGGLVTQYAHLSKISVVLNQKVNRGDIIGLSGNTGECSGGPHLHFGLAPNKQSLDNNVTIDFYFDEISRNGSPGYWTDFNNPQFSK